MYSYKSCTHGTQGRYSVIKRLSGSLICQLHSICGIQEQCPKQGVEGLRGMRWQTGEGTRPLTAQNLTPLPESRDIQPRRWVSSCLCFLLFYMWQNWLFLFLLFPFLFFWSSNLLIFLSCQYEPGDKAAAEHKNVVRTELVNPGQAKEGAL